MSQELTSAANCLWWRIFAKACGEFIKSNPGAADAEIDEYAGNKADEAREKFMAEKQDFTHA